MNIHLQDPRTLAAVLSIGAHLVFGGALIVMTHRTPAPDIRGPVRVNIVEPTPTTPPREIPKEKAPKKKPEKKVISERKPEKIPEKKAEPVLGLSANSLTPDAKGMAAPIGNTLLTEDEGKRLKADQIGALSNEDLSADARLIRESVVKPNYTQEAIDAGVEGVFVVDVFVTAAGDVTEAELRKKIGFGMDAPVMEAVKKARFIPRKNKLGKPVEGWTEIKFRLEIPG